MNKKSIKPLFLVLWILSLFILSRATITTLFGSTRWILAGGIIVFPLIGRIFSFKKTSITILIVAGIKAVMHTLPLTLGIPTIAATLSLSLQQKSDALINKILDFAMHVLLPLCCIIFFVCYPTTGYGWPYALYWLIPPCLYFLPTKALKPTIFTQVLASTFVAHAIGSIMWLVQVPMNQSQWLGLIPIVAYERLFIATFSTIAFYVLTQVAATFLGLSCKEKPSSPLA